MHTHTKLMPKLMALFTLIFLSLFVLTACGGSETETDEPAEPAQTTEENSEAAPETMEEESSEAMSDEQVTLRYGMWGSEQLEAHEAVMAAFEEQHPNIKVEIELIPFADYWGKLQTSVAGDAAFDVFWMNGPNFPVYAAQGSLMNLQPLVNSDNFDTSVFPQSLVDLYSYEGDVYGISKDFDTIALIYNKDLFDAAGVDYPTADWTWDDLKAAAAELTTEGVWGFAAPVSSQELWLNFIHQNGGDVVAEDGSRVLVDEPAACDAIKFLYSFVDEGLSPSQAAMQGLYVPQDLFGAGTVAMVTTGSWMAKPLHDSNNIGIVPLPQGEEKASIIHGLGNVAWSGTEHPEAAWELLKFLGGEEAALIQAEAGAVIPSYQGTQQIWVDALPEEVNAQAFIDSLEFSVPYPTVAAGPEWLSEVDTVLTDVWLGNIAIEDACAEAAAFGNAALADQ